MGELLQQTEVVVIEEPDVFYSIFQQCDPVDTDAKCLSRAQSHHATGRATVRTKRRRVPVARQHQPSVGRCQRQKSRMQARIVEPRNANADLQVPGSRNIVIEQLLQSGANHPPCSSCARHTQAGRCHSDLPAHFSVFTSRHDACFARTAINRDKYRHPHPTNPIA